MIAWLLIPAWGCPPTAEEVNKARLAFEDAEVESAQAVLQAAVEDLGCQSQVVDRAVLLELYRLDALVALSSMDTKAAVYSTIRAVAVDPSSAPPPEYGPELARLHTTWSERLRTATATLSVRGAGTLWLDGEALRRDTVITVPQGEHLVQIETEVGFTSAVQDVVGDGVLDTGVAATPAPVPLPRPPDLPLPPDPLIPVDLDRPDPNLPHAGRHRPPALWVASAVLLAAGAGVVGWGSLQEKDFKATTFESDAAVSRATSRIRVTYGTGYTLLGVGAVLTTTNVVGFPVSAEIHGRW